MAADFLRAGTRTPLLRRAQILEAYLNLAPYGRNIEGAGAASEIYFGKSAARLSEPEAIALSVIPQSPTRRALVVGHENAALMAAQKRWYRRVRATMNAGTLARHVSRGSAVPRANSQHRILSEMCSRAKPASQKSAPRWIFVSSKYWSDESPTTSRRIAQRGIENAAALLIDFQSMEVLAQVGSADFTNAQIHGQVDGTRRPRSPGSTLKPFVYALALDQGRIHPLTLLKDAPRSFGDYNPENFDREFLGPIRACDALARSRNVPAVTLASELSHPTLYEFLRNADVSLPQPASHYGLSLPLGGAEVTMEDLVRLYAALANDGRLRALHRRPERIVGRQWHSIAQSRSRVSHARDAGTNSAARNDEHGFGSGGAGVLENRHVARISRRVVGRSF